MPTRRKFLASAAGAAALPLMARPAFAQAYPDRAIRMIVAGSPGGPTDVMGRLLAQRVQTVLGRSIVIDARGGGGGTVAAKAVATADPDGYTLLFCNTSVMATIPALSKKPEYDPVKDFAPVAKVSQSEQLLVVHPDVPVKSLKELVAYAKANPGKLNCGATGFGGLPHMSAEYFKVQAGVDFAIVNYKGGGDTLSAVLGHQVDMTFETTTVVLPHIREGKMQGLAISSEARHPQAPEIPTFAEAGVPGYTVLSFNGVVVPAKTPTAIVEKLSAAIMGVLRTPEMQADVKRLGGVLDIGTPQDFSAFIGRESKRWRDVVEKGRIEMQ
ncbi:MAG: tripartite tricarboxylate transporter substrate binding protein [Alphaproteobacteria bacterium]|nr:tripartite tricarboxylate transporter substrate binding protein [Alphaproteobacteria bacterium]